MKALATCSSSEKVQIAITPIPDSQSTRGEYPRVISKQNKTNNLGSDIQSGVSDSSTQNSIHIYNISMYM